MRRSSCTINLHMRERKQEDAHRSPSRDSGLCAPLCRAGKKTQIRPLVPPPEINCPNKAAASGDLWCPIMLHLSLALLGATASLRRGALVPEEADGPVERGTPGAKCWGQCGGPGSCPQFCGRPEQWSGSCCELKALGSDQPDECVNRGCIGFACCVQDCDVA